MEMLMNRWWKVTPLFAVATLWMSGSACNTKGHESLEYDPFAPTSAPVPGPQPSFGTTTQSLEASPPPISGGTLTIAPDGRTAVAADSDRDRIYVVDIPSRTVKHSINVAARAEPGRVAIDSHGRAHVALRSTGNVATVDLATGAISERHVCVWPRGIAFDAQADTVHVACSEGVLVSIPLAGGEMRRLGLDRDIRDVVVTKSKLLVSRFRAADVIVLDRKDGTVAGTARTHGGNLGWRIAAAPAEAEQEANVDDEPAIVSQDPINPAPTPGGVGYYGSGSSDACSASTITSTLLSIPGKKAFRIPPAVLPVDLATNGHEYTIVAAGNGHTSDLPQIFVHQLKPAGASDPSKGGFSTADPECLAMGKGFLPGQAIAAAYDGEDQLIVQSREPAKLFIMSPDRQRVWKEIVLSEESREDTGHAIFHSNSGGFLACASCHAEGGEDGRTWEFIEGFRRTPSMRGTIANTAPFHWDGEMKDVRQLVSHVFETRMSGPHVKDDQVKTLQTWLEKIPAPPKMAIKDAARTARGETLFTQRGCAGCHMGSSLTNNETVDVGTGGKFQVPSLVGVAWRAPFIHTGCAKTLKDRFDGSCGGEKHGDIVGLTPDQIDDLTAYVESL
jgi:mono/diheme cytochrome c family protein